jgi:hypothetical protein
VSFYGKLTSTAQQTYEQTYSELWRMKTGSAVLYGRAGNASVAVPVTTR